MALPGETRGQIFRHVLPVGQVIHFGFEQNVCAKVIHKPRCFKRGSLFSTKSNRLAVLLTCKQNYQEARPILLGTNQWFTNHIRPLRELLPIISTAKIATAGSGVQLRDVSLFLTGTNDTSWPLRFICRNMPALRHLQVTVSYEWNTSGWLGSKPPHRPRVGERVLRAASQFTGDHPTLKRAIWNR